MAESWVRLWAGMTTDPKWQTIARKSGQPRALVIAVFAHLMLCANDADDRGSVSAVDVEDTASALDVDESAIAAVLEAMQGRVIIDGRLSGWERRQPKREDSAGYGGRMSAAERKRAQRDREKLASMSHDVTQCHAVSRDVTQCPAPEAEAEAEAEAEEKHSVATNGKTRRRKTSTPDSGADTPLQAACRETWAAYSDSYAGRYGTAPVRAARVNSQIKALVQAVGAEEAPQIAAWFVRHPAQWYVTKGHDIGLLLTDITKLRTEWATGRVVTTTAARQSDRRGAMASAVANLLAECEQEQLQ